MCLDTAKQPQRGAYLVVMGDYLVAQDLAESIAYYDPTAEVILRHTVDEGAQALEFVEHIEVAFVGDAPQRFAASPFAKSLMQRGARVVLIGDEAEAQGDQAGWRVLQRPFSMSLVLAHLVGAPSV